MKNLKEGLDHKHLQEITIKYHSDHRKHRYELVDKPQKKHKLNLSNEKMVKQFLMLLLKK